MLKQYVWLLGLVLCACGQSPISKTAAVTNGDLVLGIVPLEGGESEKDQRYRLLVCKALPEYSVQALTDKSVCRSALLTQDGEEVDLVGNKLDEAHKDIVHLPVKAAAEERVLETVLRHSLEEASATATTLVGLFGGGATLIGVVATLDGFPPGIVMAGLGVGLVGLSVYSGIKSYQERKFRKERMARIGDEGKRTVPKPTEVGLFSSNIYGHGDTLANKHLHNITSYDIHDMASLEQKEDLRAIVVAMARFYRLRVNEAALQF